MAEKRMVSKSISFSEKVNELPDIFDMLLFTWIIPHTDDFGRLTGRPAKVKSLVVPMLDKTKQDIEISLGRLHEANLIQWYEVDGDKFIQVLNFDKHQQGLHKRTKSKYPEPPSISRNFPEIPLEGKGREEELNRRGTEEEGKGREMPAPDSNPHKDLIHKTLNDCDVKDYNLYHLDTLNSYIGMVDIEVILAAIKKGSGKHINYTVNTLKGFVTEGITKKEQLYSKPKVGEYQQSAISDKTKSGKPRLEVVEGGPSKKMTDEERAALREKARMLDERDVVQR